MGFRYQELKERGDSIELERRESFTTERSHNGYIKRRKTIVRERFPHPNAKELRNHRKQQPSQTEVLTTQRQGTESGRTTTETFGYSPGSRTLLSHCRDKSHLERAVNRTSVQLRRLAHEIDNEIAKLKRERDKLMLRPRPHPLMRNAAIQNDLQCDETTTAKVNLNHFNAIADNIEFTIEKFSSQHKFVCTSPRYARDEQTSCRPRMRTIGLQKDTQRNSVLCDSLQNLKAKLGTAIQNSATNLANLKAKGLLDPAPPNCYAFDYGGTGDAQNALKIYHLQNCRCTGGCNPNNCNCQKICERYNTVGNYNGMLCNKNTYVEKGVTPCSEYKYCHDEYHYDYPRQNSPCAPCLPCVPCQPCPPCALPCLPPCPTYNESQPVKPKMQVIYGRRMSDLNTDEFYHPTGSLPTKHSPTKHGSARRSSTKERLTVDVPKDGRTSVDIERHGRAQSKSHRKRDDDDTTKQRGPKSYEGGSPDKSNEKRQFRERKTPRKSESSGSADSLEKTQRLKNKEKLLEITFTKERRRKASSGSGDEGIPYELQKPSREYTREAKRSMKQMTITAYKPCKPEESEGESEGDRKKRKKRKSKGKDDDRKSEDNKTWDERLRQEEQQPRVEQPREDEEWRDAIPTISEFYDNYRVGDTWEADYNVAKQQYVGGYREPFTVSPRRSYDIIPVQKGTVRDIPPTQSPGRGRRSNREGQSDVNEVNIARRPQRPEGRYTAEGGIVLDTQVGTGRDYTHGRRSDSFSSYGAGDKTKPTRKSAVDRDYESGRSGATRTLEGKSYSPRGYVPDIQSKVGQKLDHESPGHRDYARTVTPISDVINAQAGKSRPSRDYESGVGYKTDKEYVADRPSRADYESSGIQRPRSSYAQVEKPRSAREYDQSSMPTPGTLNTQAGKPRSARESRIGIEPKSDERYMTRADYERSGKFTPGTAYATDGKPISARDYDHSIGPDTRYMEESPSRAEHQRSDIPTSRTARDFDQSVRPKYDKRYISESLSGADHKMGVVTGHDATYSSDGKPRSSRDYDHGIGPKSGKKFVADSPSHREYEHGTSPIHDTIPTGKLNSERDYDHNVEYNLNKRQVTDSHTSGDHEAGVIATPGTENGKQGVSPGDRLKPGVTSQPGEKPNSPRDYEPSHRSGKPTSERGEFSKGVSDGYATDETARSGYIEGSGGRPNKGYAEKGKIEPSSEYNGVGKADVSSEGIAEVKHREINDYDLNKVGIKTEETKYEQGHGVQPKEAVSGKLISPQTSVFKNEKLDSGSTGPATIDTSRKAGSPLPSARTGNDSEFPVDGKTFRSPPEVPEIHIEDHDESERSGKTGKEDSARVSLPERAKFAIKGEMVLETQQTRDNDRVAQIEGQTKISGKIDGPTGTYRKPDIGVTRKAGKPKSARSDSTTESSERFGNTDKLVESYTHGRMGEALDADGRQQLSPFPSLESPRIYMRPRSTCPDYKTSCSPPTNDCTKKSSPRGNCIGNAGDVYMCKPESYNNIPPSSPCPCLSPRRSCIEIPYEKLGDQYTHSPVRQLAANSHLAVALQPDAATGNYIPSPQPRPTKNCIYLRSTGTQYSATIIENHEGRCAPQYIPLPKDCSEMSLDETKDPLASCCPQPCDTPCEELESAPCTQQNNYKFICEEENDECEEKINLNNEHWCQRVEITNSEKTQIFIEQAKENSPRLDCKNYFLPWQQDQKFVPGQPMSDCEVQDVGIQRSRYQSLMERRTPRFNATMPPHQEMPEEEARCAEEMPQYKPQPRVKFMEQSLRQYENSDLCCYSQAEETNESRRPMHEYGTSVRPGFNDCREYQQIPKFTGCPCMFKTYLNMITLYYPDCPIQMPDDAAAEEDGCYNE